MKIEMRTFRLNQRVNSEWRSALACCEGRFENVNEEVGNQLKSIEMDFNELKKSNGKRNDTHLLACSTETSSNGRRRCFWASAAT